MKAVRRLELEFEAVKRTGGDYVWTDKQTERQTDRGSNECSAFLQPHTYVRTYGGDALDLGEPNPSFIE